MAYFVLAVMAILFTGCFFALTGALVNALYQKYIKGDERSFGEIFSDF